MIPALGRRADLARMMGDRTVRALSVDVYDTLLLRGTQPELARFGVIARAQHAALTVRDLPSPGAEALWRSRLRVHKAAYDDARAGGAEVTLERLTADLAAEAALPPAVLPVLMRAEVTAETAMVRPNNGLARMLAAVAAGKPVVLTSDMYLRGHHLREILARHLPVLAHLPLLVSSDAGASKRRGDLYQLVAEHLDLPPGAILHLGDDPVADVLNARLAGLRACWCPRVLPWRILHGLRRRLVRYMLVRRTIIGAQRTVIK